jgi:hypothetical protein
MVTNGGVQKLSVAVPFPQVRPDGYEWLGDEPAFDPTLHLDIQAPTGVTMLTDLGYRLDEIAATATPVAFSTPFRILSDDGAAVLLDTARRLRAFQTNARDRIENMVRGGCYRSRWLRDLCLSSEVTEMMAQVYGTAVAPHSMPLHLGHLNYEPASVGDAVDKWHHDTLALDYVMMVSDPTTLPGGRFEVFLGTKDDAATLAAAGKRPPTDRVLVPDFPGPGWAIALHGNMVVHRGAPLDSSAERITMVNGYVSLDRSGDDQSRSRDLVGIDDPAVLATEWARHAAWRGVGRLQKVVDDLPFGIDNERAADQLEEAITDVQLAIRDLRTEPLPTEHYEHGVE